MIPHITNLPVPKNSTPYTPAKYVNVPNGGTAEMEFTGRSGATFGFNRILPGGQNLNDLTVTAELNEDWTLFKDIKLSVLRDHFKSKALLAPFIIQENNTLRLTISNPLGSDKKASVQLLGYDAPYLKRLINAYSNKGYSMPKPVFLHANDEIGASAKAQAVDIKTKAVDVRMVRATIKTDSDDDILVTVQIYNESVKNKVFIQQFNDEFESNYANVPFVIGKAVPLSLITENLDSSKHDLCFLGESYVMNPGE
jgi:hypothetical protein